MEARVVFVFVIIVLAPISVTAQNQPSGTQSRQKAQQPTPTTPISVNCNCTSQATDTKDKPQGWHKFVTWPEGIATWALIFTLGAIVWQAIETRRAAQAASKSVVAVINSERAWLTVKIENFNTPKKTDDPKPFISISAVITNHGKTPARTKKIFITKCQIPVQDGRRGLPSELPPIPDYSCDTVVTVEAIVAPNEPLEGISVYITPEEAVAINAREKTLYVYGFVEYSDTINGKDHKTGFCSLYWVPHPQANEPSGFVAFSMIIPPAYRYAT